MNEHTDTNMQTMMIRPIENNIKQLQEVNRKHEASNDF